MDLWLHIGIAAGLVVIAAISGWLIHRMYVKKGQKNGL